MTDTLKPEHLTAANEKIKALSAKLLSMQQIAEQGADPQVVQADFDKAVRFYTTLLTNPPTAPPREPAPKPAEFNPQLPFGGLGGFWPETNDDFVAAIRSRAQRDLAVEKDLLAPLAGLPLDALRRLRGEVIPKLAQLDGQYIAESFTVGDLKNLIEMRESFGRDKLKQDMRQAAEATLKEIELDLSPGEEFLSAVCAYRFLLMSAASGEVDRVNALAFELEKAQRKLAAAGVSSVPGKTDPEELPDGEQKAEPHGKPQSKEQPWNKEDLNYIPNSEAITRFTDGKMTLSALSKLCRPDGPFRYMRKGQKCRVHIADFHAYARRRFLTEEERAEAAHDFIADIEARKATEKRRRRGITKGQ